MTSNFDFSSYLSSANLLPPRHNANPNEANDNPQFEVTVLSGGYTNFTARVTFPEPISLAAANSSTRTYESVILKHAPPHLATDSTIPMSVARQATEARALELITGAPIQFDQDNPVEGVVESTKAVKEVLDRYPIIQVPAAIHYDTEKNVIWLEDLGDLKSVADALTTSSSDAASAEDPIPESALQELATQLGSFLVEFYQASKTLPAELVDRLIALSNVYTSGTFEYLVNSTRDALDGAPGIDEKEKEELVKRVEASLTDKQMRKARQRAEKVALGIVHGDSIQTDDEENPCLGMVDFWPGSVLVNPDWNKCGLIDWEYFGMSDEASELGMFLAHIHITKFKPSTSPEGQERLGKFMSALFQAYSRHSPSNARSKGFQRRFLISHGRELVNGIGMYKDLGAKGSQNVMEAGVRSLRAAGPSSDELNLEALWEESDESGGIWLGEILSSLGFLVPEA
ncbi:hypothetical protein EST38_g5998 [Candolleomyces aberdarensis]|uniref:Aminoglycoside phosphotransferase domain-containing protein n=1 Tax=Candolleomyces aberdarensis TaxID=2316362 RepID=A0A4Q2DM59_9AGAR|nr:hypothetical protein EST38_g5998 [Candolleomyces aberdarensis]